MREEVALKINLPESRVQVCNNFQSIKNSNPNNPVAIALQFEKTFWLAE